MKTGVGGNKMKKTTILDYLDTAIEKKITDYDVALDWDTKNHTIEIVVRLFAENQAHFELDDAQGVVSEEDIIEFEDGTLSSKIKPMKIKNFDFMGHFLIQNK